MSSLRLCDYCFLGEEFAEKEDENDFCADSEIEKEKILEKENLDEYVNDLKFNNKINK